MVKNVSIVVFFCIASLFIACQSGDDNKSISQTKDEGPTAKEILGNKNYQAIAFGGYRMQTREIQPTIAELKEDLRILNALGIKVIRTYQTELEHPRNVLKAIKALKSEDSNFEMYMMVGAWINCENAWSSQPNHDKGDFEYNKAEIDRAVEMAKTYPDIVKIISVGNEAMVRWATSYYVHPKVILHWVEYLQDLKGKGELPKDLWITSSDNFASWGGGDSTYQVDALKSLIKQVDYISMHTYPMHDTHYNPSFWGTLDLELNKSKEEKILSVMHRALDYAKKQYGSTKDFVNSVDPEKEIHIGETGWASVSNGLYGPSGSKATDEYKSGLYYKLMREWTNQNEISCFYFEAFDEPWKDANNKEGSENHFGLFTVEGKAKYPIWDLVDTGAFKDLTRGNKPIVKTFNGSYPDLMNEVQLPSLLNK